MNRIVLAGLIAIACATPAMAQYPERPVTILSGYPAGGMVDVDYRPGERLRSELWREYRAHTEILKRIGMIKP